MPRLLRNSRACLQESPRIGRDGVAIAFVTPEQGGHLTDIEMTINKLIDEDRIDGFEAHVTRKVRERPAHGAEPEAPPPARKAVFGKSVKKYSSRL